MRQQLIEIASTRPDDIRRWYENNTTREGECMLLNGTKHIPLLFRGKLRHYDASIVLATLADVKGKCKINPECINVDHLAA